MKILTSPQIHELDRYTIEHEPISSIDLMERASRVLTRAITAMYPSRTPVVVFAGPGNNGGDALAVSRMLAEAGYSVNAFLFNISGKLSADCESNFKRLSALRKRIKCTEVCDEFEPPQLDAETLVVDGLFGTGLNKPLTGGFASLVKYINQSAATVVSIDIPSGLMTEDNTYNVKTNIVKADVTLTLQQPKLAFMLADNQQYIGDLQVLDIGLSEEGMRSIRASYTIQEMADVRPLMQRRDTFGHKGDMGSALIVAGSHGMAGAAILASRACLRAGAGKVTVHTPWCNNNIMQISVPEAIVIPDIDEHHITESVPTEDFDAVAVGPGIRQDDGTAIALITQIRRTKGPLVLDADALNILASHRAWMQQLPQATIITPHPGEFERMSSTSHTSCFEQLNKAREMAEDYQIYIILKGHYSALCLPDGQIVFNSTGNAGMATAGSGDVLTGIIAALLARGYNQDDACRIGMFLHGLAGDFAAKSKGMESLIASDIIAYLPEAFKALYGDNKKKQGR